MRNRVDAHARRRSRSSATSPCSARSSASTSDIVQKTNLILVLTPYIIREQSDLRTVFERKMQERQEFLDRYFVFDEDTSTSRPTTARARTASSRTSGSRTATVEEQRALDELTRPQASSKGTCPAQPLEMPANVHLSGEGGPRAAATGEHDRARGERGERGHARAPATQRRPARAARGPDGKVKERRHGTLEQRFLGDILVAPRGRARPTSSSRSTPSSARRASISSTSW